MTFGAREGRPAAVAYVDDDATGARCHVEVEAHLERCDAVFEAIGAAWTAQVDVWGWPAPLPDDGFGGTDGLDIYIHSEAAGGAFVNSGYVDADPDDGRMGGSSYMVLAPSISVSEYPGYISHEFNHVLQFAVDMSEPTLPPWEGTATLAEERTYPGEGSAPDVIDDYQDTPWAGPLQDGYWLENLGYWSWYEYGSVLLMQWLEDAKGMSVPQLWLDMSNPTWTNEPDFLDVLTEETWREFTVWRATQTPGVLISGTLNEGDTVSVERVQPWGVVYVDVSEGLTIEATGRQVEVVAVHATRFAVIDWGPEGFDGDDSLTGGTVTVSAVLQPGDSGEDSGPTDTGEDTDEPTCAGCGSVPGPSPFLLLALLAVATGRRSRDRVSEAL